jgi:hypothetical protein
MLDGFDSLDGYDFEILNVSRVASTSRLMHSAS